MSFVGFVQGDWELGLGTAPPPSHNQTPEHYFIAWPPRCLALGPYL